MLDVVYLAVTIALFAVVGLVAKGVEKLGPWSGNSTLRDVKSGGDQG